MNIYIDFQFKIKKDEVISKLSYYNKFLKPNECNLIFNSLLPVLYEYANPYGVFKSEKNSKISVTDKYDYTIFCAVTLGNSISKKIDELFDKKDIKSALVLDSMAVFYLFEVASQLFEKIYKKASKLNLGLTPRISPGNKNFPLKYQKYIIDILKNEGPLDIKAEKSFMLNPIYSMAYLYGADSKLTLNKLDHSCDNCKNKNSCNIKKGLI